MEHIQEGYSEILGNKFADQTAKGAQEQLIYCRDNLYQKDISKYLK